MPASALARSFVVDLRREGGGDSSFCAFEETLSCSVSRLRLPLMVSASVEPSRPGLGVSTSSSSPLNELYLYVGEDLSTSGVICELLSFFTLLSLGVGYAVDLRMLTGVCGTSSNHPPPVQSNPSLLGVSGFLGVTSTTSISVLPFPSSVSSSLNFASSSQRKKPHCVSFGFVQQ